jgi:hypothetical protein
MKKVRTAVVIALFILIGIAASAPASVTTPDRSTDRPDRSNAAATDPDSRRRGPENGSLHRFLPTWHIDMPTAIPF